MTEPAPVAGDDSGTVTVRRITWEALWRQRPDLRPPNNNRKPSDKRAA